MNKRGIALIAAYMIIAFLGVMGSAFVAASVSEGNNARRYADNESAFWIAEAGMAQAYRSWGATGNAGTGSAFGGGSYVVDTTGFPQVVVRGTCGISSSAVEATFTRIPTPFSNTLSVGHDLTLSGLLAKVDVYDRTRISGAFSKSGLGSSAYFQNKLEGVSPVQTTIPIPDYSENGTNNEFADFVAFGRKTVQNYPPEETVYVQSNGTVNIFPSSALLGKKVIFVEGTTPGAGNVNIFFDATWRKSEDLTVISTGTISYVEPLQFQEDARLSTVSWKDYNEVSIFRSEHESVIYAHENATFVDILDWGSTTGNVIINNNMSLLEVLTYEKFYYSNRSANGDMAPGFSFLGGSSGIPHLTDWRELNG